MHALMHQMKDADFDLIPHGNADTSSGWQMMSYSHVEKNINKRQNSNLNLENEKPH